MNRELPKSCLGSTGHLMAGSQVKCFPPNMHKMLLSVDHILTGKAFTQTLQIIFNCILYTHRLFLGVLRLRVAAVYIIFMAYQQWSILWKENNNRSGQMTPHIWFRL